jgi:molybdate transport system substrate-binding protein
MRIPKTFITFALAVVIGGRASAQGLTVSAAVSLKEALSQIARSYERESATKIRLNFGASGQILAQIREGAPVDVFISASDAQMNQAETQNLTDRATRRVIARNSLVLIVPSSAKIPLAGFADLTAAAVKRLGIGEPRTVPAGDYAMQVLRHLKLDEALAPKLIAGASVRQVLDYVERGEVDAGIVYATDARQSGDKVRIVAQAQADWHEPIAYPAAIVAASKHHDAASQFIDYLTTPPAQAILRERGFAAPSTQPTEPRSQQTPSPLYPGERGHVLSNVSLRSTAPDPSPQPSSRSTGEREIMAGH